MVNASRLSAREWVGIFVAGGLGGALLDQIHVRAHVLAYAHPDLAGQPWWVAPQFGIAVAAIMVGAFEVNRGGRPDRVPFAACAIAFVCAYAATGLFHRHPWLVLSILLAMWVAMLAVHQDRAPLLATSLILLVAGPIYESLLTWTGAFHYTAEQLVLRVPFWLPALYLNAGVVAGSAARALMASERPSGRMATQAPR